MATTKRTRTFKKNSIENKRPTRITRVSFKSSIELKSFQHAHIEVEASVGPNDNPTRVLDEVKDYVARQLHRAKFGEPVAPVERTGKFEAK